MLPGKRKHKRFEVFAVVEIKSLKAPDNFYVGITKNFSVEGFSFESHTTNLDVGDSIQFRFKHPQYSSDVFYAGTIVWKQKNSKFNYFMGVKFKEIDEATKSKMLSIVSFAGNIPVDSFLSDKGDEDIRIDEPVTAGRVEEVEAAHDKTLESDIEKGDGPETTEQVEEVEAAHDETLASDIEKVDEPETTGRVEEVEAAHDETLESDIEKGDGPKFKMDSDKATYYDVSLNKDRNKKTWLSIPIAIAILVALFVIFKNYNKIYKSPAPVSTKSASLDDIDKKKPTSIVTDAPTDDHEDIDIKDPAPIVADAPADDHEDIDKKKPTSIVTDAPTDDHEDIDIRDPAAIVADAPADDHEDIDIKDPAPIVADAQTGNVEYYIQVAAWEYLINAEKLLLKLKQYYPEAYIAAHNNLYKVRIPDIMNKKQGAIISKDLESKFKVKPIIVLKTE